MSRDLAHVLPLLQRDVETTLGPGHAQMIAATAADVRELHVDGEGDKLVEDVQQYFHDTFVDTAWPACPRHARHPLWYRDGSWWCVEDGVAVARLGELRRKGEGGGAG
jgi:hypothetical protein